MAASACATAKTCSGVYLLEDMGWYEKQMKAAGAKPLCSTGSAAAERYRLIWLRSFHNPIIVTLVRRGDSIELTSVRLDGAGGYAPGRVVERKQVALSVAEFNEFRSYLGQMNFWNLKSEDQLRKEAQSETGEVIVGMDGAQWILEGASETDAHAADRWSDVDGPFKDAALFLLNKSSIDINGPIY
jgi:hypothetical protein